MKLNLASIMEPMTETESLVAEATELRARRWICFNSHYDKHQQQGRHYSSRFEAKRQSRWVVLPPSEKTVVALE